MFWKKFGSEETLSLEKIWNQKRKKIVSKNIWEWKNWRIQNNSGFEKMLDLKKKKIFWIRKFLAPILSTTLTQAEYFRPKA